MKLATSVLLRCKFALISGCLLVILSVAAAAQTASTGALTGTVTDSNGAVVSEVQITVTSDATGEVRTVASQPGGVYVVPLLLPGTYSVEFAKTGFKTAVKSGLEIIVTETARLDVQLQPGGVQEKVTITWAIHWAATADSILRWPIPILPPREPSRGMWYLRICPAAFRRE
jgi:hypothetical protein